jgi:hypothetical protein
MEVFLLSHAVKSNKIDLGRAGFLYEAIRHLPLQRFDSNKTTSIMPECKEQEALSFKDVYKFCSELIEKGDHLAAVIAPDYPDAERVREEICNVLKTVETYEVVGKWVTSCSGAEYVTTQEICSVSIFSYSF